MNQQNSTHARMIHLTSLFKKLDFNFNKINSTYMYSFERKDVHIDLLDKGKAKFTIYPKTFTLREALLAKNKPKQITVYAPTNTHIVFYLSRLNLLHKEIEATFLNELNSSLGFYATMSTLGLEVKVVKKRMVA